MDQTTQKGFNYGLAPVDIGFFAFDIYTPEGRWVKPFHEDGPYLAYDAQVTVPVLYCGPFNMEHIKTLVDGPSAVPDATHLREGIVITPVVERRTHGLGRVQLKLVSNAYLEKDSK